jgi:drug/metabolite transporter (DMT)-like permease
VKHPKFFAYLAFAIVCVVWGTTYLAIAIAIETLPTFLFPGLRFTLAGAILLGICLARGEKIPRRAADWANLALIGFLMVGIGNVAVVWAEHFVSSGFAALLVATAPLWMVILESMRKNGERVTLRKAIGMTVGFAGVGLLVARGMGVAEFTGLFIAGVVVLQLGCIAWNYGSIRSKYHPTDATPLVSASIQMLTGGLIVTLFGLAVGDAARFSFTPRTLAAFLYLMIFGSIVAYGAYVYALAHLKTSTVSLYAYINPAVAVFLGWLILDEPLGPRAVLAMAVIFAGVAIVQSARRPRVVEIPSSEVAAEKA